MTISAIDLERIMRERRGFLEKNGVFCVPIYSAEHSMPTHCERVTLRSEPLPIQEGSSLFLAQQVAQKQHVHLTKYDFGRGEDEVFEKFVFSIECEEINEMDDALRRIEKAKFKLTSALDQMAKQFVK